MRRIIDVVRGWALACLLVSAGSLPAELLGSVPSGPAVTAEVVRGVVVSSEDGSPVPGARIVVEGTLATAFTDATGRFRIAVLDPGEHTLVVERIGFVSERVNVFVGDEAGRAAGLEILLTPEPVLMTGVVVAASGELQRRLETPASVSAIDGEVLRRVGPAHPSELLNRVPGVWVSPTSTEGHFTGIRQPITTKPVYLFLEDGIPTRSPGFFNHNALYEVNVPQADRIEVIRGPGTALYGSDAIGGVIDVGTRPASLRPQLRAVLEGSSNDFYRALVSLSGSRGADGVRVDLNVTEGGGWRDAQDYDRRSATLRWDRTMAGGSMAGNGTGAASSGPWPRERQRRRRPGRRRRLPTMTTRGTAMARSTPRSRTTSARPGSRRTCDCKEACAPVAESASFGRRPAI